MSTDNIIDQIDTCCLKENETRKKNTTIVDRNVDTSRRLCQMSEQFCY